MSPDTKAWQVDVRKKKKKEKKTLIKNYYYASKRILYSYRLIAKLEKNDFSTTEIINSSNIIF